MKKECTIIFITATIVTIGLGLGVGAGPGGAAAGAGCPVAGVGAGVGAGSGGYFLYFEALNLLWIPQEFLFEGSYGDASNNKCCKFRKQLPEFRCKHFLCFLVRRKSCLVFLFVFVLC